MANDNEARAEAGALPPAVARGHWLRAAQARLSASLRRTSHEADSERTDVDALSPHPPGRAGEGELRAAVMAYRKALIGVGVASGLVNLLSLTGPLFMLQIYDRVLPSRSLPTLVALGLLALVMFGFQGILEMLRGRILLRIGRAVDARLSPRIFDVVVRRSLQGGAGGDALQPVRDLDNVRSFTASVGLSALFDLPWLPLYAAVCFMFHPWMGVAVLAGAILICSLTVLTEALSRGPNQTVTLLAARRQALVSGAHQNAAVIRALGMSGRMMERWWQLNERYLAAQQSASDLVSAFGSLSRVLRLVMQAVVLAVGACLVIAQEATAGVMLAATILSARALAPVELAIANWRPFTTARQSWRRLKDQLAAWPASEPRVALPAPLRDVRVTAATVVPPGAGAPALHEVSFAVRAGSVLGVIGPSGSGKTSLARALVGVWPLARGTIRIDGATIDQWEPDAIGRCIGYLSQEVDLFDGTVAENIARFEPDADPRKLVTAAQAAGVHEIILRLPQGYQTPVGERGELLSGGQRQRIALARALYGDPFLVVLDEPNSNLDSQGERALAEALMAIRARGGIAIVIAHRPAAVSVADHLLILNEGRMQEFGPRDRILQRLRAASGAAAGIAGGGTP